MLPIQTPDNLFKDGVPGGDLGTPVTSAWLNAVQAELNALPTVLGVPLSNANNNLMQAIGLLTEQPLAVLPLPTIATSDNRITVNAATVAGQGGTVSIPAGIGVALAQEVAAGVSGRQRSWQTAAWTSPNLAINSTYFLRAQVVGGVFTPYIQAGADYDLVPGSLRGTQNGANGGGFVSTPLDICLAKIKTGAAGTLPTIQRVINGRLSWTVTLNGSGTAYLPFDPLAKNARMTLSIIATHATLASGINFPAATWGGGAYAYLSPISTAVATADLWNAPGGPTISSANEVGECTLTSLSAGFDHGTGRSMWQCFQAEHLYGRANATGDELLLSMSVKNLAQADYDSSFAMSFVNCVNAQVSWELMR